MAEINENNPDDNRAAKRARTRAGNGCGNDRVILNVGGTTFVTAASTLKSNSTYFEAMLSHHWNDGNGKEEIFVDQDPTAFGKILAYMRRGLISVDDIDTDVLALAEFLGVVKLLQAVKVRSYHNLHPTFVGTDEEADAAFVEKHGGILEAISAGLLPGACKNETVWQKDYAMLFFGPGEMISSDVEAMHTTSNEDDVPSGTVTLVGALNWLHWHGYTKHEPEVGTEQRVGDTISFSRPRRIKSSVTGIFTPSITGAYDPSEQNWKKQYVLILQELKDGIVIQAPAVLDSSNGAGRHNVVTLDDDEVTSKWVQENGFWQREQELEELFKWYIKDELICQFPRSEDEKYRSFKILSKKLEYFHRQGL